LEIQEDMKRGNGTIEEGGGVGKGGEGCFDEGEDEDEEAVLPVIPVAR
jgi:hypothetical protein